MTDSFFPSKSDVRPSIYAYSDPRYPGMLKVGFAAHGVEARIQQQYPIILPDSKPYTIHFNKPAVREDGSSFSDHDVHRALIKAGIQNEGGEWFTCTIEQLQASYLSVYERRENLEQRRYNFKMRPEQVASVQKTSSYFKTIRAELPDKPPKFLWNAKMRFGKTFAAYQLAKKMGMKKILVLTFKPAVESAWEEDLLTHIDFEGWQFISRTSELTYENADKTRPIVCFGSFQDYLGTNGNGGIKAKNEWVHTTHWDLVIFDEYHFGAWRENAKNLFKELDEDEIYNFDPIAYNENEASDAKKEDFLPITTNHYLFLSGTPFRAIYTGEFIEEQIFSWTYSDEQLAKEEWGNKPDNPYAALPRMVLMTYEMPEELKKIALKGEFNEFDLNVFFMAEGRGKKAKFKYQDEVQKWLDLIRGAYLPTTQDHLKLGAGKPATPFSDTRLLNVLNHTLWFLPNVAACHAMANLLAQQQNTFYHDYKINVAAGTRAGVGRAALLPVLKSMKDPLESKTITLTCGKLTTGVTVRPWTGIFMLRNLKSPETYFQSAFRVQSPWEVQTEDGKTEIIKKECYIFDFALNRALKQIADYSTNLNVNESNPEKKVAEFIRFLPVLAYDGSSMVPINAADILDWNTTGTTATLLAKRWESTLLVNVDNDTLRRLMANQSAIDALMRIEGFRSLNQDLETIINKSEAVKKARQEREGTLTAKEKKELSEEEKEFKSLRKQIRDKLIKLATRLPVFMYLTDYREYSLRDVITQLETGLFKSVTGLEVKDFELLVSLNVFNGPLMNDAVWKFKRYEDESLEYTGINRHKGERVGAWDTSLTYEEYLQLMQKQN